MMYEITGGIEKGIHYTRIVEQTDDENGMQPKESVGKSHGETEAEELDSI
jgi:hypothetical protein